MSNSWGNFLKFVRTTRTNKKHVIFVGIMSAFFRFATLFLPFKWFSPLLGPHKGKTEFCTIATPQQESRAWKTGNFIEKICEKMPWEAKCLVRAYILRYYLDRYKIPYVLHVGLAKGDKDSDKPLLAHAWVTVGRYTVSGGDGPAPPKDFTVIGTFVPKSIADKIII